MSDSMKKTKGNPVFLAFAIIAIISAMIIFAILLTGKKSESASGSNATDSHQTADIVQKENARDLSSSGSVMVTTLDGETYDLTDFEGKIVILDFWATWCKPCMMEMPHFIELYNEYKEQDFIILALSVDRSSAPVKRFVASSEVPFPVAMATPEAQQKFGPIEAIPTTFVIDHNNKIRHTHRGMADKAYWEAQIKPLIAEREAESI